MLNGASAMKRLGLPTRSGEQHLALIDEMAGRIRPDTPSLDDWYATYVRQHRLRLASDLEIVTQWAPGRARLLEYGAVPLVLTAALVDRGFAVSAVDVDPDRFGTAIAELQLDVRSCDVETEPVPFESSAFDAVVFNELFEHLRINPIFTLGEAHRVLKPDGILLLSTPNLRSFRGIRNLLLHNQGHAVSAGVYRQYEKLATLGHMGHVREYTTHEVASFLTRVGFSVETVIYRGGHGTGVVGFAERLAPSLRPFFSLVATKEDAA